MCKDCKPTVPPFVNWDDAPVRLCSRHAAVDALLEALELLSADYAAMWKDCARLRGLEETTVLAGVGLSFTTIMQCNTYLCRVRSITNVLGAS